MERQAPPFHALSTDETLTLVQGSLDGLGADEAALRLERHGPNQLPETPGRAAWLRFVAQFHNVLIYVLLVAAAVTATFGHLVDTGVILAVVLVNAVIGFVQEGRAEQAMQAVRGMLAPRSTALRDGRRVSVEATRLVPGDVVLLEAGDRVPADIRVLTARGLSVDEAMLTGESVPVAKHSEAVDPAATLGDRQSMLYSGTFVASGTGRGVVVDTGAATQIGQISGMLSAVETLTTPLVRQMDVFARWLTVFILLVAVVLLVYGATVGHLPFADLFMAVIGLSVAAIPEGLPAVLTITLAVGVQAMARRQVIVRRLPAIETLGAVSVICSDKTGTLTRNEMLAARVETGAALYDVDGDGYAPEGVVRSGAREVDPGTQAALVELGLGAGLCSDAVLHRGADGWRVEGDPMEGALVALAGKVDGAGGRSVRQWTRLDVIPFDAAHRFMAVLTHDVSGARRLFVKGAPEAVLAMCVSERSAAGGSSPLAADRWHARIDRLASQGLRVIAIASRDANAQMGRLEKADLVGSLTLLGLVGLVDPPRPETVAAVAECHAAGIGVKMITGDHAVTAQAIGAQVGLRNTGHVLTGADIEDLDDAELAEAVLQTDVFARTSPRHKLRLVAALQSRGLTVAMTGDGVNDAPALKRADAGIAMGLKGSAVAKESAELVLVDDNFASIVAAVREGRTVYDNIKKVISWTLPTSTGEAMTIIVALFAGLSMPITAVQILWINLITAVTLGLALAFEPGEPGTMRRPPRRRDEPLLVGTLIWHIVLVSTLFLAAVYGVHSYAVARGESPELARTLSLNMLAVLEIFHLFFIRNIHGASLTWAAARGTRVVWACVLVVTAAQFSVTYVPALQAVFGTASVPLRDGLLIVAIGVVFFVLIEVEKQMRLALRRPDPAGSDRPDRSA
ncbi:MAG: HAD-IC family P-type ATPase [Burkholderiaceae bacterium]